MKCKRLFALLFALLLLVSSAGEVLADWPVYEEDIRADTICVMEANTGVVLFDREMNTPMFPASVTKIMTTLVALENGELSDQVTMSEEACFYVSSDSSNLHCQVGEVFTLEQLLYGTMIYSANEMATQVAIHVGGSVAHFCEMMNARAADLGCTGTHFVNANGMPDEAHVTTAYDMSLIMRAAIKNEKFVDIVGTHSYVIPATNLSEERAFSSHNALLVAPEYALPGIIGGKTGFTYSALHTLVNAASREGMTLIVSTFRTADPARVVEDQVALFNYFFANYELRETELSAYADGVNKILLPKEAPAEEVTSEIEEGQDASGNPVVHAHYSYDGKSAGTITLTAEAYERYLTDQKAPAESQEAAENAAEDAEETVDDAARLAQRQAERDYAANRFKMLVFAVGFVSLILVITIITLFVKIILALRAGKGRRE